VVSSVRDRVRQDGHPEALQARAADRAEALRAASRNGLAARRGQSRRGREARRRRIAATPPVKGDQPTTEIFGPVLSLREAEDLDDAIEIIARNPYCNAASIVTSNGAAARKFRYEAPTGNIGVNIGVAAPMAYVPFSGWKDSVRGVLHGQGRDAIEFYTDKKVVVERWPKEWSRKC
jgi:acyl-CoA reductase-like NAD-dependent aldehyde dehydrogenase